MPMHTPEPWSINAWPQRGADITIGAPGTALIAIVPLRDVSINEQKANARLIANAAKMRTELHTSDMLLLDVLDALRDEDSILWSAIRRRLRERSQAIRGILAEINAEPPTHQIVDFGPGPTDETIGYPFQGSEAECVAWLERHQEVRADETNRYALQDMADTEGGRS
jgi:hypothetical protein